jgi:hypothetical protein
MQICDGTCIWHPLLASSQLDQLEARWMVRMERTRRSRQLAWSFWKSAGLTFSYYT